MSINITKEQWQQVGCAKQIIETVNDRLPVAACHSEEIAEFVVHACTHYAPLLAVCYELARGDGSAANLQKALDMASAAIAATTKSETNKAQVHASITLSTGRIVSHERMQNGAQSASITPGNPIMTEDEWVEYCKILREVA